MIGQTIAHYRVTAKLGVLRRGPQGGRMRVVVNWTEELKQIITAGGIR